jgi:hypothetical protein
MYFGIRSLHQIVARIAKTDYLFFWNLVTQLFLGRATETRQRKRSTSDSVPGPETSSWRQQWNMNAPLDPEVVRQKRIRRLGTSMSADAADPSRMKTTNSVSEDQLREQLIQDTQPAAPLSPPNSASGTRRSRLVTEQGVGSVAVKESEARPRAGSTATPPKSPMSPPTSPKPFERARPSPELALHNSLSDIFCVTLEPQGVSSPSLDRSRQQNSFFLRTLAENREAETPKEQDIAESSQSELPQLRRTPPLLRQQDIDAILVERLESFSIPQATFAYLTQCFGRAYELRQKQRVSDEIFDDCARSIITQLQLVLLDNTNLNLLSAIFVSLSSASSIASLSSTTQALSDPKTIAVMFERLSSHMEISEIEVVFGPMITSLVEQLSQQHVTGGNVLGPLQALSMLVSVPKIAAIVRNYF